MLILKDETDGSETRLSVTASHPFHHTERGWVHAGHLTVGDKLTEDDGGVLIIMAAKFDPNAPINLIYNLHVADFHTYFVGEDRVLMHNRKNGIEHNQSANKRFRQACHNANRDPLENNLRKHIHDEFSGTFPKDAKFKDIVQELTEFLRR